MKRLFDFTETRAYIACSIIIYLIGLSMGMTNCSEDDADWVENTVIIVSSEKGIYYPWGSTEPIEGLKIRKESDDDWTVIPLSDIEGFSYEEGCIYHLNVEITHFCKSTNG